MQNLAKSDIKALKQLPRLKSLLKKYRQVKTKQAGLLKLSELSSSVTEMKSFYQELQSVFQLLLTSDSFHIVLADRHQHLSLAYCHNDVESHVLDQLSKNEWNNSLTALVYKKNSVVHCDEAQRNALTASGDISFFDTACVDWLGVPLVRGKHVIGVVAVKSFAENVYFNERDCQLLQFIAEHLVTAIDRVRSRELLETSIKQRTAQLTATNADLQREISERQKAVKIHKALLSIAEITASTADMTGFYQALHHEVNAVLPAKNLSVALLSEDKSWIEFPYASDEKNLHIERAVYPNSLVEYTVIKAQPVLVKGRQAFSLNRHNELIAESIPANFIDKNAPAAWLAAPLIAQHEVFGVIYIQHYQDEQAYQHSDIELLHFVSQHIAIAIWRNRVQAKISSHNDQLEKRILERTQALQVSNSQLKQQIEERRRAEAQLYYDAHHDTLTKLANRAMFADKLAHALRHIKRHPNHHFAVLFIDLDRFKVINDTLGHHAGDLFLIEIAARLKTCVRDNDILARLGGDEFVILLDSLQSQDDVEEVASRIIASISQPFQIDGHTLYSNASIGITLSGQQYDDANDILRDADAAMYQAKNLGRGRYVFFDDSMREQLLASITLEQELRRAIDEQQFELHYQAISELEVGQTIAFEALLRWQHPTKGLLLPQEFLFCAEETGLLMDIEAWVIEEACAQLKRWQHSQYHNANISINLFGRHLTQANKLNSLIQRIQAHTAEQHRLILEFNESIFVQHRDPALKALKKLKKFGVKLALDNFGAGQSSFNYLHSYPFSFIKLAPSFTRGIKPSGKQATLLSTIIGLGNQFGYRVVGQGIETKEALSTLQNLGCEFGQGYFISRPEKLNYFAEQAYQTGVRA